MKVSIASLTRSSGKSFSRVQTAAATTMLFRLMLMLLTDTVPVARKVLFDMLFLPERNLEGNQVGPIIRLIERNLTRSFRELPCQLGLVNFFQ